MNKALAKMKTIKAMREDGVPIEASKCSGEIRWIWLTRLFNKILSIKRMSNE